MISFNALFKYMPDSSYFLYNTTASYIDPVSVSYNDKVFMLYDGNVPRHTYSDIYYYTNNIARYNLLKKDIKHIQLFPIYTYNDSYYNRILNNKNIEIIDNLVFIQNSVYHKMPEYIQYTNMESLNRTKLTGVTQKHTYGFYDARFDYPYRSEFIFPLFLKFSKVYIQVMKIFDDNRCLEFDTDTQYLFTNIFNLEFEKFNDECFLVHTDNMNVENYMKFLVIQDSIREHIINMTLNVEMPNFSTYDDVLDFYKGVE